MITIRKKTLIITGVCWSLLGFSRGLKLYDYQYKKNKECNIEKTYLYSNKVFYGFYGSLIYMNPFFTFITIPKEIYRLEVIIRGIDSEKNKDEYYELLWK